MRIPLQLWNRPHWEVKGRWDIVRFFESLPAIFPDATTLFIEGTGMASDVVAFLISAAEPGDYLPDKQTIWPRPKQYRVRCDSMTLTGLKGLAERHAIPELLDHLFIFSGSEVLMEFPDAFAKDCPAFISADVDEQRVRSLANMHHLTLNDVRPKQAR